jgi:hypothetical protein
MGDAERYFGQLKQSAKDYDDARRLYHNVSNPLGEANVDFSQGVLYKKTPGKRTQAVNLLARARESYIKLKLPYMADQARKEQQPRL